MFFSGDDKSTQGIIGYGGIKMVNGKHNVAHGVIGKDEAIVHHRHSHVTHTLGAFIEDL